MDEVAKTEARNYLSAAGFFVIAAFTLLGFLSETPLGPQTKLVVGLGLLLIGTLLVVLRKRDMIALLFMMYALFHISTWNLPEFPGLPIILCFNGLILLILLVTLTGKDKAKWLIILIPLMGMLMLIAMVGLFIIISNILVWVIFAICTYFALACASERLNLPGRKLLTADEETDFKASGSVLGYMLFGLTMAAWAIFNLFGESYGFTFEALQMLEFICAVLMVFVSILLFAVGKMRFTPVMFLLIAMVTLFGNFSTEAMSIGLGVLFLLIGIFAILRKESRILPGIMLVLTAVVYFLMGGLGGFGVPTLVLGIIEFVIVAISVYLAFVVYSQKKLPKF